MNLPHLTLDQKAMLITILYNSSRWVKTNHFCIQITNNSPQELNWIASIHLVLTNMYLQELVQVVRTLKNLICSSTTIFRAHHKGREPGAPLDSSSSQKKKTTSKKSSKMSWKKITQPPNNLNSSIISTTTTRTI